MSIAQRTAWTQEAFFTWAAAREERYEFDGFAPVAMTGGTIGHSLIQGNINAALRGRLRGSCRALGPDAGIEIGGDAVRYPDALITCAQLDISARTVPDVVIVFEVLSPSSERTDRIIKVREYAAIPSILRYVIAEYKSAGVMVLSRSTGSAPWTATTLDDDGVLVMPEVGIEVPIAEIYAGIVFPPEV